MESKVKEMNESRTLLKQLMIGIALWAALVILAGCLVLNRDRLSYISGVLAGGLTAVYLLWSMYHHLDIALSSKDSEFARKHVNKWTIIRMFVMMAVIGLSMAFYQVVHPVGVVLGIWGIKPAAWIQPILFRGRDASK